MLLDRRVKSLEFSVRSFIEESQKQREEDRKLIEKQREEDRKLLEMALQRQEEDRKRQEEERKRQEEFNQRQEKINQMLLELLAAKEQAQNPDDKK